MTQAVHPSRSGSTGWTFDCDVAGKSVLVVTSDPSGTLEVLTRGARDAVVVDVDPQRVREAHSKAESLGMPVRFHCMNIEDQALPGVFDVVLCVDVLQRVRNPMQVIDRLIAACRETLILDLPGPASAGAQNYLKDIGVPWWQRSILDRLPVILVGRSGTTPKHSESKFYFSPSALRNVLTRHRWHFDEILKEEITSGWVRVTASRRARIENLIVVAGPSGGGKSTFIRSLENREVPEIAARLGIEDIASWRVANSSDLPFGPATNALILHYDFLRPWKRDTRVYQRDETLELLRLANQIVFVTVWARPELLEERVRARITLLAPTRDKPLRRKLQFLFAALRVARPHRATFQKAKNLFTTTRSSAALEMVHLGDHERLAELYRQPDGLVDLYRRWFEFCRQFRARAHWIVETSCRDIRLVSLDEWIDTGTSPVAASITSQPTSKVAEQAPEAVRSKYAIEPE